MEGGIHADAPLDYAAFEISPTQNRYEAFVCHDNRIEKVASGLLEQLMVGLPEMNDFHPEEPSDNFKLQLPESMRDSAWFTKSTLARFLHVVGAPELLKISNSIGIEMSQLEEARRFHLALYSQGHQAHQGSGETDSYNLKDTESTQKPEGPEPSISSSDVTKNELLRAMDLRLTALREDLAASFNRAAGATCSTKQIADLMAFSEHFGALDLRNFLCKYLALREDQTADPQTEKSNLSLDSKNESEKVSDGMAQECSPVKTFKAIQYGASPAKAAQLERQSSTGSERSSNSSDEERTFMERSRPLVRSGSSRRSASPMRRVQIGKSGSRRAAALTIKSLSYFPARERVSSNRDASGNGSEDEESDQPPKKPESNVRRMSVKDAINLFERKQNNQKSDVQIKMPSPDVSISTNKAVLRRWSSGMGDSSNQCPSENGSEGSVQTTAHVTGDRQKSSVEVKPDPDFITESLDPSNSAHVGASSIAKCEKKTSDLKDHPVDTVVAQAEEIRVTNSVEWSRQKEAELSQMLKMMEKKPARSRNMATGNSRSQDLTSEQRGGFYDHYKQKRDEKLRGQNSGKRAEKEEQFKALQDILDQRKAEMASKNMTTSGRQSALAKPKSEKKLSPSVQPKKESLKPAVPRKPSPKASPKASPLPATRKSWPSAPSPKTTGPTPTAGPTPTTKTPNGISSTGTTPTRRKTQPTPSPTLSNPKVERPQQQQKSLKGGTQTETKRSLKAKEEKQQQAVTRGSSKVTKTKSSPTASGDGPGIVPTKPSFYSKVTRKGSVVPLESKPFLRKGSGIGPGVGPVVVKTTKASQSDESLKNSENPVQAQEEVVIASPEPVTQQQQQVEEIVPSVSNDTDLQPVASVNRHQNCEDTENHDQFLAEGDSCEKTTEFPVEVQSEGVSTISPNAWVEEIEEEHQELPVSCDINSPEIATTNNAAASAALSSPRVRHSLSQMLQEESGEPEIIEWGNAENPPAMVYQKDAPKGLKRLLKFARKSKGESNTTGWSSPSVFSEGEEDAEESKAASKRNADAVLRKAALQAKGYGLQKTSFGDNYNGENPNTRTIESIGDLLSAQSNISKYNAQSSHKLPEGHASAAASSTKATRSFFSLSTFRSSKSNETKLR